jgi:hypothetical protein
LRDIVGAVPSGKNSEFIPIVIVFDHAEFDILTEIFPKLIEGINLLLISGSKANIFLLLLLRLILKQILLILRFRIKTHQHINRLIQHFGSNLLQYFFLLNILSIDVQG